MVCFEKLGLQAFETFNMRFMPARFYRKGRVLSVRNIVIHCMQAVETPRTAENVGTWWQGFKSPKTSAHFGVDNDSEVMYVHPDDTAYHCTGANAFTIGIELAGYAEQTPEQWADSFSSAMLERATNLTATLCRLYSLPIQYVNAEGLLKNTPGITTHADFSKAFKKSTHIDPGKNFPMQKFIADVQRKSENAPVTARIDVEYPHEMKVMKVGPASKTQRGL